MSYFVILHKPLQMIPEKTLIAYNARIELYEKGELIFDKDDKAQYYYQVEQGQVKMNNYSESGKEFIQGIFNNGDSFGEPPLFADVKYPAAAEALENSRIYKLPKSTLIRLLKEQPEVHFRITERLSKRLYFKSLMASEISSEEPEHRIVSLLHYLKRHVHQLEDDEIFVVDLKRQQIADLTGLRVETVIRACKSLEKKDKISIVKRKVHF
ncbi:MAG: Crp/Fnr family transcriptional regulator [Flavobacteriaceae bacterium]|nr:Crp/Fnr family transcriptional regulator [Psychroflexus sp.]